INFVINNVTKLIDVITEQDQLIQENVCEGCGVLNPIFNSIQILEQQNKDIIRKLNTFNVESMDLDEPRSYARAVKSNNFGKILRNDKERNANVIVIRDNNQNVTSQQCMKKVKQI